MRVYNSQFDNSWYNPGRSFPIRILWHFVNAIFMQSALIPSSAIKVCLLKLFGAKIGKNVNLKPSINIKYPWNLTIGDYSWLGEYAWLDSISQIKIGNNVCISQGVYICTGNHDWNNPSFDLVVKPVVIEDGAWLGAHSVILPGVTIASHAVVTAGSVMSVSAESFMVYAGNPAVKVKERIIK